MRWEIPATWRTGWEDTFMKMGRIVRIGINAVSTIVAASIGVSSSWAQSAAPRYEVDVTFPKPFPDRWVTGGVGGHCIDAQDGLQLLSRARPVAITRWTDWCGPFSGGAGLS